MPEVRKLPEANEFSPGQVDLRRVLELVRANEGDRARIVEAIRTAFFATAAQRASADRQLGQQRTRASNVLVGMNGYKLFDRTSSALTPIGAELLSTSDEAELYRKFAQHILLICNGILVLQAVRSIQARRENASKANLDRELRSMGFELPRATTHHTKVLQWLRLADVVDDENSVNDALFAELTGAPIAHVEQLSALSREQRAFLRALRAIAEVRGTQAVAAKDVIDQAVLQHGAVFREDQLAAKVFRPLETSGWIKRQVPPKGRGGKSGFVAATEKLLAIRLEDLTREPGWDIPPEVRARLNTPLDQIYVELDSPDSHVKGIALELFALRLATDLGLTPVRFRLRGTETGGAELDLVCEAAHLIFSRWLFQCKNQKSVDLADLAKEIGMSVILKAQVVVIATTGDFRESVKTYADRVAADTHLQVVLLDKTVLAQYRSGGAGTLLDFFHRTAGDTLLLKRPQFTPI